MTAWTITEDGRGYLVRSRCRNEESAIADLIAAVAEKVRGCLEIRSAGASRKPVEVTAEWLLRNCREVTRL